MGEFRTLLAKGGRCVGGACWSFALWLLWFVLAAVLVAQVYIATRHELAVPGWVLRRAETRLAESGFTVRFARTTLDPTGRVLVEAPQLISRDHGEAVLTARAAYLEFNPWAALVGHFAVRNIEIVDAALRVPAMLSPSGRSEPVLQQINAEIVPGMRTLHLRHLTAEVAGITVSVSGTLTLPPRRADTRPGETAAALRRQFAAFAPRLVEYRERLRTQVSGGSIAVQLEPATPVGAMADISLVAQRITPPSAQPVVVRGARVATRLALNGDLPSHLVLAVNAAAVDAPRQTQARQVAATVTANLAAPAVSGGPRTFAPVSVELTADEIRVPETSVRAVSARLVPAASGAWQVSTVARAADSELEIGGEASLLTRTASFTVSGPVSPRVMEIVNGRTKVDVRRFFNFDALTLGFAHVRFGPGWKFEHLRGHAVVRGIHAYGVFMEDGEAWLDLTPERFYSPQAYARIGENFAHGTYEHHFGTREFRFLLHGRLRPMEISPWFQDWWPRFFERLDFPVEPPLASVDVHGFWRQGRKTSVFVFADTQGPVIRGQKLSRARTRLFIRPGFYDVLEAFATDAKGGSATGVFTVVANPDTAKWRSVEVEARSTIDFDVITGMGGAEGRPYLSPFSLVNAPSVTFRGRFDGPDIPEPRHYEFDLAAHTTGPFAFHGLPFEDVSFTTTLRDDVLTIDGTQGRFAGGAARLHAKVWGVGAARRIGFDATLNDASLGMTIAAVQKFSANRKGLPTPPENRFVREKANVRLDLAASADGRYGDILSFEGNGTAGLRGAEIGEVALFGPLSELLTFTSLRFTSANGRFKIAGPKVHFPEIAIRGDNAAIDAHGDYLIDRGLLDFRARVYPFQESGNVIKSVVGAVLTPISNALEVKLNGSLEKPEWAFVMGPTNLFRSLSGQPDNPPADPTPPPPPGGTPPEKAAETPNPGAPVEPPKPSETLAPRPTS